MGGGTKLQGLTKYLQQTIQVPFAKPDSFNKLMIGSGVSAAKFTESVGDFGVVYGLALQGLGVCKIETNLLPRRLARRMAWTRKGKYLTAAACGLLVVSLMCFARSSFDRGKYSSNAVYRQKVDKIISSAQSASNRLAQEKSKDDRYRAVINKELDYFKHRDVLPLLHKTITFAAGDVEKVLTVPRRNRKQLFVTTMQVHYAEDIGKASFKLRDRPSSSFGSTTEGQPGFGPGMPGMGMFGFGGPAQQRSKGRGSRGRGRTQRDKEVQEQPMRGFVVTIEGFSPYGEIDDLIDPAGAGTDESKWGVVTRFMNLNKIFENCSFELYKKDELKHFEAETGDVDFKDSDMPDGIGLAKPMDVGSGSGTGTGGFGQFGGRDRRGSSNVLIDPMTKEVISRTVARDENGEVIIEYGDKVYNVNDHWFRIKAKFVWKDITEDKEDKVEKKKTSRTRRNR